MKKILILLFFAGFAINALQAGSENLIPQLKYVRELKKDGPSSGEIYTFPLDLKVYENSKGSSGNFRDLRIFSGEKAEETPYSVSKQFFSTTKKYRVTCESKVLSLKKLPDNRIEVIVKNMDKKLIPSYLTIRTSDRNYDKQIGIEMGNDIQYWDQRDMKVKWEGVESSIFDYSAIIDLKNNSVKLPKGEGQFYRIVISNFSETKFSKRMEIIEEQRGGKEFSEIKKKIQNKDDFRIDKIILEAEVSKKVAKEQVSEKVESKILKVEEKDKKTRILIDVFRQPVIKLQLKTESLNFSRKIEVKSSNDKEKWRYLASDNISRVAIGDYNKKDLNITIPENKSKYLLLIINNGDAPVLKDIQVQAYSSIYQVEFLTPQPLNSVRVYYGASLDSPKYDIDEILGRIENPGYNSLSLEEEKENPDYSEEAVKENFLESKTLLYSLIGIMVLILGAGLFKTVKKIDEEEKIEK